MHIFRNKTTIKFLTIIIGSILIISIFVPGLTSKIVGFGSGIYSGVGEKNHTIISIGDLVVSESDIGIIFLVLFSISIISIYLIYNLWKKWNNSEKANK